VTININLDIEEKYINEKGFVKDMVHEAKEDAKYKCPRCNSGHVDLVEEKTVLICLDCGYEGQHKESL